MHRFFLDTTLLERAKYYRISYHTFNGQIILGNNQRAFFSNSKRKQRFCFHKTWVGFEIFDRRSVKNGVVWRRLALVMINNAKNRIEKAKGFI